MEFNATKTKNKMYHFSLKIMKFYYRTWVHTAQEEVELAILSGINTQLQIRSDKILQTQQI